MLVPLTRPSSKRFSAAVARPITSYLSTGKLSVVTGPARNLASRPSFVAASPAVNGVRLQCLKNLSATARHSNIFGAQRCAFSTSSEKDTEAEAKKQEKEEGTTSAEKKEEPAGKSPEGEAEAKAEPAQDSDEVKLAKAEEMIKTLEEEKKELKHKYLTALADVENMRMRMNHKAEEDKKFAVRSFAKNMLEVADCLEKALEAMPEEKRKADENLQKVYEGVAMIDTVFLKGLEGASIKKFVPTGEKFDPNMHNAMFEIPAAEGQEKGMVGHVVKSGYMIYDRVLRPAEVGVTKEAPK